MNIADGCGTIAEANACKDLVIKEKNLIRKDGYLISELFRCSNTPGDWKNLKPYWTASRYGFAGSLVGYNYFDKDQNLIATSMLTTSR